MSMTVGSGDRAKRSGRDAAGMRWVVVTALVLAGGIGGCEEESGSDVQSYTDSAGRSCTVDLADISQTATCDADPMAIVTCEAGDEAAFVINDDYDFETRIYTLESCAACVDRAERMTYIVGTACVNVECVIDDDCMYARYTCQSGVCRHM